MQNVQFKLVPVDYSKPYDEQPECKRHVIGAYANLARHNMTLVINTIMQAIGMPIFNENDIEEAFTKSHRKKISQLDNIQKVNLQKRLYRHFLFLKRMKLEDETKKSVQLNSLLEVLDDFTSCMAFLRNFHTHYLPYNSSDEKKKQLELKRRIGKRLQYLYENSCQLFKCNEKLDHSSNEVLSALRIPNENIEYFHPGDAEYDKLLSILKDPKGKKVGLHLEMRTGVISRKTVKYVRNPEYQAYMINDEEGLSDVGIIYFLCLFLDKQVAFDFMEEVGFTEQIRFGGEHADLQLLYLKEMMCMNRIRMVKSKIDSEMTDTALALDMLNELRKCPKPLYEVLDKEAREEFKDDATVQWELQNGQEATSTEDSVQDAAEMENLNEADADTPKTKDTPKSTFVRWEDRFPQMALKYIDLMGVFEDIRFQLRLGKYRFTFYKHNSKYSIDNEERLRVLQKEIHGFGRIQEVNEKMKEKWNGLFDVKTVEDGLMQKDPDTEGRAPYITEQKAQYHIDEKSHSIGIRWEQWNNPNRKTIKMLDGKEILEPHYGDLDHLKMFIPHLPRLENATDGSRQKNQAENLLPPQSTLSLYELPALLFYHYLLVKYKKDQSLVEQAIKDTYQHLVNFLTDVSNGTCLPVDGTDEEKKNILEQQLMEDYNLRLSDIPQKIKSFLLGMQVDNNVRMKESAIRRLEARKEKLQRLLNSYREKKRIIGTKENKFDRMRASIKTGALAQWLMRDIMDWLPLNSHARKNLSGESYVALQSCMAMMGQCFGDETGQHEVLLADLHDYMINAHIIAERADGHDAKKYHPFMHLIFRDYKGDSIEDFYEMYLEKEWKYIDNTIAFLNKAKSNASFLFVPFLHYDRSRWKNKDAQAIRKLAASYLERPLQLPDGIFTTPIFELLKEIAVMENDKDKGSKLENALTESTGKGNSTPLSNNVAYLIRLYFELIEGDHSQPFYDTSTIEGVHSPYRHVYRIFKKLYGKKIPHTNQTTTPAYTIEELRDLHKQALLDIKHYVEIEIDKWKDTQQWKFERDRRKKYKKENDKRFKNKEKQLTWNEVNALIDQDVCDEIESLRSTMTAKLTKQLKKVYDNERTIRRFKTQDILMLIMAREVLKARNKNAEFTQGFNLKYVMFDSLLDKTVDFTWDIALPKQDKEKTASRKTIMQKNMKMKNYGQFYKFVSDHQRLESLLSRLPETVFLRAEIENEFAYYDTNRAEVFRQVYVIESEAYKLKPELKNDDNANEEWFCYTDKRTGKRRPKRNNFMSLLEILAAGEDGVLDETEKKALQSTRNAFGHNTYDVDLPVIFKGKEEKMKIPEIANGISDNIAEQTKELKKNLDK